jgi:hypothetical protein
VRNVAITQILTDSDGDFMDDAWENTHFGSLEQRGDWDYDEDGSDNRSEYAAGTLPGENTSRLLIGDPAITGANYNVSWASVSGKKYQLQFTPSPLTPSSVWQNVGSLITATGASTARSGSLPSSNGGFMRVEVLP